MEGESRGDSETNGVGVGSEKPESRWDEHGPRAAALRSSAERARLEGDAEGAERDEKLAEVEDALAEFRDRAAATEQEWVNEGWRAGSSWEVARQVREETAGLEHEVVREGEDPRIFDLWRRSEDPAVERRLRVVRRRLLQFQKLLWRTEILAELGQEILEAEATGSRPPDRATGFSRTAGALDYRDEMLARWRARREAGTEETT